MVVTYIFSKYSARCYVITGHQYFVVTQVQLVSAGFRSAGLGAGDFTDAFSLPPPADTGHVLSVWLQPPKSILIKHVDPNLADVVCAEPANKP